MQSQSIMYGVIGLLAGILVAIFVASSSVNSSNAGMMRMMGIRTNNMNMEALDGADSHMGMSMSDMSASLKNKSGDTFDRAFIAEMIDHHQGAIDMAKLAKQNAKHDEIKNLADDIIVAQTKEISQMKQWRAEWGY